MARRDLPAHLDPPQGFVISRPCGGWELLPFPGEGLTCYLGPDLTWVGGTLAVVSGEGSESNKRKQDDVQGFTFLLSQEEVPECPLVMRKDVMSYRVIFFQDVKEGT